MPFDNGGRIDYIYGVECKKSCRWHDLVKEPARRLGGVKLKKQVLEAGSLTTTAYAEGRTFKKGAAHLFSEGASLSRWRLIKQYPAVL